MSPLIRRQIGDIVDLLLSCMVVHAALLQYADRDLVLLAVGRHVLSPADIRLTVHRLGPHSTA